MNSKMIKVIGMAATLIDVYKRQDEVWEALADPDVRVVAQIAPAVRVAVGDHYSLCLLYTSMQCLKNTASLQTRHLTAYLAD